jgi:hypothetical protein
MVKSIAVIEKLVKNGSIPEFGDFDITDTIIDQYQTEYKALYEKVGNELKSSNKAYARKLAGVFLMKENQDRLSNIQQVKITKSKFKNECGIVYVISNPAFHECYKVGITKNLDNRLRSYQTYDPNRSFKVEHYRFVKNSRQAEKEILSKFNLSLLKGEWIKGKTVKTLFIEEIKNL